jgi:hypothetical protein
MEMNIYKHLDVTLNWKTIAKTYALNGWFVSGQCQQTKTNYSTLFFN